MLDDLSPALAVWRGCVLALPVEGVVVDPVVEVAVVFGFALIVEGDE